MYREFLNELDEEGNNYKDCPICHVVVRSFFHYTTIHDLETWSKYEQFWRNLVYRTRVLR